MKLLVLILSFTTLLSCKQQERQEDIDQDSINGNRSRPSNTGLGPGSSEVDAVGTEDLDLDGNY